MDDYSMYAINIPKESNVRVIRMGDYAILDDKNRDYLLTFGLATCVGISIVIKTSDNKTYRLLSHVDMGQNIGIKFNDLYNTFNSLKNKIEGSISSICICLTSSESLINKNELNFNESALISIIITAFKEFGICENDIIFFNGVQVQISPDGVISNFTREELSHNYWQEYIQKGYDLVVGTSFLNSKKLAVYLKNYKDQSLIKYGAIPGCVLAINPQFNRIVKIKELDDMLENVFLDKLESLLVNKNSK